MFTDDYRERDLNPSDEAPDLPICFMCEVAYTPDSSDATNYLRYCSSECETEDREDVE